MSRDRTHSGIWALILFSMFLAGCGGSTPAVNTAIPPVHADELGNVVLPEGFPADVPRYPGARVAASSMIHPAVSITLETDDARDKVVAWYTGKLPAGGWAIEQQKEDAGVLLIHTRKGGQPLSVEIGPSETKTRAMLKYTPKSAE